jgi:thymidine kinase
MSYGHLTVVCGPMFASKTTELLKRILWARNGQHKAVLVVKPAFDDRFSTTKIVSHDGLSVDAHAITQWDEVKALADDADMVCLDEVQFFTAPHFTGEIVEIICGLLDAGKEVVITGLDMDWQGKAFNTTAQLAAMADILLKPQANCTVCGRPAGKTHKKEPNAETVELGATDLYEARCNEHWNLSEEKIV